MFRDILLPVFIMLSGLSLYGQQNTVSVEVSGIRSESGLLRMALYNNKNQFPNDPAESYYFEKKLMRDGIIKVVLIDIPPGTYAISVLDDEDGNDKMKFNLLRMPKEGYGFSNNIKPGLKHPPYEECTFDVRDGLTNLKIEIQYFREKS